MSIEKVSDREKTAVIVVLIFLLSQVVYSYIQVQRLELLSENFSLPATKKCHVEIKGAVKKPGVYDVYPGVKKWQVLKRAKLKKIADIRALQGDGVVTDDCEIYVPELENLVIYIRDESAVVQTIVLPLFSSSKFVRDFLKNNFNIILPSKLNIKPFMTVDMPGNFSKNSAFDENKNDDFKRACQKLP